MSIITEEATHEYPTLPGFDNADAMRGAYINGASRTPTPMEVEAAAHALADTIHGPGSWTNLTPHQRFTLTEAAKAALDAANRKGTQA